MMIEWIMNLVSNIRILLVLGCCLASKTQPALSLACVIYVRTSDCLALAPRPKLHLQLGPLLALAASAFSPTDRLHLHFPRPGH